MPAMIAEKAEVSRGGRRAPGDFYLQFWDWPQECGLGTRFKGSQKSARAQLRWQARVALRRCGALDRLSHHSRHRSLVMFQRRWRHHRSACHGRLPGAAHICTQRTRSSRCRLDGPQTDDTPTASAMNDAGESSAAAPRPADSDDAAAATEDIDRDMETDDDDERTRLRAQLAGERRLDAKRKRIRMLNELLRELDLLVYMQFMAEYYLEYDTPAPRPRTSR
jgi:hypothetical protein